MTPIPDPKLRDITRFPELIAYLCDELDWPIDAKNFESYSFDWDAAEDLGVAPEHAAKIKEIKQLRPLVSGQPWGVFFIEFEPKKLPIGVLRRLLNKLVTKQRASANSPDRQTWSLDDLLFISSYGEGRDSREIAFAHFHQEQGDLPTLRVLGWDGGDTPLKLDHVDKALHASLHWPDDENDPDAWRNRWSGAFKHRIGHTIQTADMLAKVLAELAKNIRDRCQTLMAAEPDTGPLKKLFKAFQTALIHDLTEEGFADTYAQTITYGLLTAAISRTDMEGGADGTFVQADNITDMVPVTNPFLKEMLQSFLHAGGRKGGLDFDELGVQDVVELLRGDETDLPSVLRDFGNKNPKEDPVIRFYEDFLSAYNKKLKIQRGVFYTPKPVVSYIVRSVHELLQTEFGLEDGLASTITWGEMMQWSADVSSASSISGQDARAPLNQSGQDARSPIKLPLLTDEPGEKRTIDPNEFFVQILDPATGTGTFIVEIIEVIHKHLSNKWETGGFAAMPSLTECGHPARCESGRNNHSSFLDPYAEIVVHEHRLPHWQQGEVYYFVTWRLADALPASRLSEWQSEKDAWLRLHPEPWDAKTEMEYHRRFSHRMDEWLDAGHGSCLLRDPALARIVAEAFHHFDGQRYDLDAFVVMPNHIHVLFRLYAGETLEKLIHSWKSFTAKAVNKAASRTGVLWQEDYWDRIIRNEQHLCAVRRYIEENPKGNVGVHWQRSADSMPVALNQSGQDVRTPLKGSAGVSPATFDSYWNAYVPKCLLPRLYAYELMMAPYAIAHMKIGLKLHETGYRFGSDERVRVYLTNALEPQVQGDQFAAELGQRAEEVETGGQRQAREIDLQKLRVTASVAGTVKHRVGVVKDVFGCQAGGQTARLHYRKVHAACQFSEKWPAEVWLRRYGKIECVGFAQLCRSNK